MHFSKLDQRSTRRRVRNSCSAFSLAKKRTVPQSRAVPVYLCQVPDPAPEEKLRLARKEPLMSTASTLSIKATTCVKMHWWKEHRARSLPTRAAARGAGKQIRI